MFSEPDPIGMIEGIGKRRGRCLSSERIIRRQQFPEHRIILGTLPADKLIVDAPQEVLCLKGHPGNGSIIKSVVHCEHFAVVLPGVVFKAAQNMGHPAG